MPKYKSSLQALNRTPPIELVLELNSFSGGENTIGEDHALKSNESRICKNWDPISIGGMMRSRGFNEVASIGAYTQPIDLVAQCRENLTDVETYAICEGDLCIISGGVLTQEDAAAFTSGVISHAVSAGDKLWITNSTDDIQYKTIGNAIATPADVPNTPCDRIYYHKYRLIAEGGGKTVYGSRAGTGNWTAADAWSLANDAWSMDMPDLTMGGVPDFPYGNEFSIFTYFSVYTLYNFPDTAYRQILNGRGCCAPYSVAKGDEGVYFLSNYPTLGVILWNGSDWIDLTINHDFVQDINLNARIFGIYRNKKYYILYNETGTGGGTPNRIKIYDAQFGRWMERPINATLADNMGYPCLLKYSNNELYFGSAETPHIYEFETTDDSDEGQKTEANYTTKYFTSKDFGLGIDEVRMKLIKFTATYYGTKGSLTIQWTSDRGKHSGSQVIDLTAEGDLINETFIVNTSYIIEVPPDITKAYSFNNSAVGRRFSFQILNNDTGDRPKLKKLKIHAVALEEY
jgi:hypothetical protein